MLYTISEIYQIIPEDTASQHTFFACFTDECLEKIFKNISVSVFLTQHFVSFMDDRLYFSELN